MILMPSYKKQTCREVSMDTIEISLSRASGWTELHSCLLIVDSWHGYSVTSVIAPWEMIWSGHCFILSVLIFAVFLWRKLDVIKEVYWLMTVILVLKGLRQNDLELRLSRAMFWIPGQPGLHCETVFRQNKQTIKLNLYVMSHLFNLSTWERPEN